MNNDRNILSSAKQRHPLNRDFYQGRNLTQKLNKQYSKLI